MHSMSILLRAALPALLAATTWAQTPGVIQFSDLKKDFGSVVEGEDLRHDYAFEVSGSGPVKISNIHASCGCTLGKILINDSPYAFNEPLQPGTKGVLQAWLRTRGYRGVKASTIDVFNDGQQGKVQLTISANIQQFFQITPPYVNFGMVSGGSKPTQEISVWSTQVASFTITKWGEAGMPRAIPKGEDGTLQMSAEEQAKILAEDEVSLLPEQPKGIELEIKQEAPNRYKMVFKLTDTRAEGVFAKRLRFLTDQGRAFDFTCHAVVQPLIGLDPPTHLAFGVITRETSVTQQFRLVNGDLSRNVKITGFKVENCDQVEHLTVSAYSEPVPEKPGVEQWYLRIIVLETMPPGAFRGQVKIQTDHPEFAERLGYFTGYVR
jgi:hypothetical protein